MRCVGTRRVRRVSSVVVGRRGARQMCGARVGHPPDERTMRTMERNSNPTWPPVGNFPALFTDVYYVHATTNIIILIKKLNCSPVSA